ncbi:hypothetical protein MMC26_007245 [Xylographa opegraphella]|nr:hypothetical protein [Xylographa opegraphella]
MYRYLMQLLLGGSFYNGGRAPSTPRAALLPSSNGQPQRLSYSSGPYEISVRVQELIDPSRLDPWAYLDSDRGSGPVNRAVMMSTYYPTSVKDPEDDEKPPQYTMPYMPKLTAELYDEEVFAGLSLNGSFANLYTAAREDGPVLHVPGEAFPLVMLSTGAGSSRFYYTVLAESLASTGYVVACMDHSHDSFAVELLNHTVLHGRLPLTGNHTLRTMDLDARVNDTILALDELSKPDGLAKLFLTTGGVFNVSRVGMLGHSLGGATMSTTMLLDSRIAAGVSLDGAFFGPEQKAGLDSPYLILGAEGHDRTKKGWWSNWPDMWPKIGAWKKQLNIQGAGHVSFSDVPLIVDNLGLRKDVPDPNGEADNLGTISGARMLEIQTAYVSAFFDKFLKGKHSKLLDGETGQFPEVEFIM